MRSPATDDAAEVRSRVQSIAAGVRLMLCAAAAGLAYAFATLDGAHRGEVIALLGGMAALGMLMWLIPSEHLVRSRHREMFFLVWSVAQIALIGALAAFDGGGTSPLALL